MRQRAEALRIMSNRTKHLDFLPSNRLVFAFQKNIVKNRKMEKYTRWFEFAERTKNRDNRPEDFEEFREEAPFDEMMRRLDRTTLTDDDLAYIEKEREAWEEESRFVNGYYEDGVRDGMEKVMKKGMENGEIKGRLGALRQLSENPALPDELSEQIKQQIADLTKKLEEVS